MPNYKTHSIHGELILPEMDKRIEINDEDIKSFCIGPDAMIVTDYKTFEFQHANKTKEFFESLIKLIKKNKLQDNSEIMAYLYGYLDHFVLDSTMHPLIYYMTEGMESKHKMNPHGLIENWIDDYTSKKYHKNDKNYYRKKKINDIKLIELINKVYKRVYGTNFEGIKYSLGMHATTLYDTLARRNMIKITPLVIKLLNIGDFTYQEDLERVLPYLNLENNNWNNPITGEKYNDSFDDLWDKSTEVILETIEDVNKCLYDDKELTNPLITNNTSFNTGLPCEVGENFQYVKKYHI